MLNQTQFDRQMYGESYRVKGGPVIPLKQVYRYTEGECYENVDGKWILIDPTPSDSNLH